VRLLVGPSSVVRVRSNVDFPDPLATIGAAISPAPTWKRHTYPRGMRERRKVIKKRPQPGLRDWKILLYLFHDEGVRSHLLSYTLNVRWRGCTAHRYRENHA